MADRKISDLTALTTPASGDYLPIVDISESAAASKNKRITIEELMRGAPNGTAAAPSIAFESDPNSGLFSPGADQVAVSTGGTGRLFVDSSGNVGIGTTSPAMPLHVYSANTEVRIEASTSTDGFIRFVNTSGSMSVGMSGVAENNFLLFDRTNSQVGYTYAGGASGSHSWATNGSERARIDSSGRLLVGTSTARSNFYNTSFANSFQIEGAGSSTTTLSLTSNNSSTVGQEGTLVFAKSNGNSGGSNVLVSTGNPLGRLSFQGSDGSEFVEAACIQAFVDGTPGTDDMPGRLVFSVTADGAASPTEALRISNDRSITVSDGGNVVLGTTTGTKIGTATTQKIGFYNATPVVQPTAVADATTAVDVITQLNDLLAKLRTLGIIAT